MKSVSGVRSFNVTCFLSSFCDRKWSYTDGDRVIVRPFREHKRKVRAASSDGRLAEERTRGMRKSEVKQKWRWGACTPTHSGEGSHPHRGPGCFRRGNGATRRELGCGYRESESPGPLLVGGLSGLPSLSLVSASVKWEENIEHTVIQILLNVFNCPIEA